MKIKRAHWFTGTYGTIGLVIGEDEMTGKKKAYIGVCQGFDENRDTQMIARTGSPVNYPVIAKILEDLKE